MCSPCLSSQGGACCCLLLLSAPGGAVFLPGFAWFSVQAWRQQLPYHAPALCFPLSDLSGWFSLKTSDWHLDDGLSCPSVCVKLREAEGWVV